MISTAFPQSFWQEAGAGSINRKKGIACDCHCNLVASCSTACPGGFIPGQMGILCLGRRGFYAKVGQLGRRDIGAGQPRTQDSVKALMGTPATVHIQAASR